MPFTKIIWTQRAKNELKNIYNYYKEKSLQGAKNVRSDLLESPSTVHYANQYQIDELNPSYRRIIVRDYKVLYKVKENTILVVSIIATKQSPKKQEQS